MSSSSTFGRARFSAKITSPTSASGSSAMNRAISCPIVRPVTRLIRFASR
jgi:hypothetical protein